MATSNFFIKPNSKATERTIILLFRYAKTRMEYSTGLKVLPHLWNEQKQEVRNKIEAIDRELINDSLSKLKTKIHSIYNELIANQIHVTNEILRLRLETNDQKTIAQDSSLQDFLTQFIEEAPTKKIWKNGTFGILKERTIKKYTTALNKIKEFDVQRGCQVLLKDLNQSYHSNLIRYLSETEKLADETVGTIIKNIKTLARSAQNQGISVHQFVLSPAFYQPKGDSTYVYLSIDEIRLVYQYDLMDNPRLDRVRDLFIVGLWTGQRISDLRNLSQQNIHDGFIEIQAQVKTGNAVIIPIHPMVQQIIDKYEGGFPPVISDQKFNKYVKELCKKVGIISPTYGTKRIQTEKGQRIVTDTFQKFELISSHTCRRSFATNHYGKLPTPTIMGITGHKSESAFLKYIKRTSKEMAVDLKRHWAEHSELYT